VIKIKKLLHYSSHISVLLIRHRTKQELNKQDFTDHLFRKPRKKQCAACVPEYEMALLSRNEIRVTTFKKKLKSDRVIIL
jgi:hypothetical protein